MPDAATSRTQPSIERTALFEATPSHVLAALEDPELLTAWLGAWTPAADGTATVVTDDGVARRVSNIFDDGWVRSWTWSPLGDPSDLSEVTFAVTVEGDHTRLTITETMSPAAAPSMAALSRATLSSATLSTGATATAVRWLPSLLALGAVLAIGAPVRV